jgi:hypothetical protein
MARHKRKLLFFSVVLTVALLGFCAFRFTHASVADMQMSIDVKGDLEVKTYGGTLNAKDYGQASELNQSVPANLSAVYDSTTIYLRIRNNGEFPACVLFYTDLDPEYFAVGAIWYMGNEYLLWRYGNVWRSYNGSYFTDKGGERFADLPTASWQLFDPNEGVWLKEGWYLPLHIKISVIQPLEAMPTSFTLTVTI